jgi:hypothetical protein
MPTAPTGDDGCETHIDQDPSNCGACGHACPTDNVQTPGCSGGNCNPTCDNNYTNCGGSCVDEMTDTNHCGGCGTVCPSKFSCDNGTCACIQMEMACTNNGGCMGGSSGNPNYCQCGTTMCSPGKYCQTGNSCSN